jgi:ABC-2 type transport system permease protein
MKRTRYLPLMLLSILALFLAGNHLSGQIFGGVRLDLTQQGLYRLSPGTAAIVEDLNEPVEWQFYYSRAQATQYPAIRAYASRVREFMRAYSARSGGQIRLIEIDPMPFSEEEDQALEAGLLPIPTQGGERLFFGLVANNSIDEQLAIPVFDEADESRLEYALTRIVAELEREARPRLAILTGLALTPETGVPNVFITELANTYDLVWLERGFDDIPAVDALLIMHPGTLSEGQLYLIDQFALNRGQIALFLDPMAHMALRAGPGGLPPVDATRGSDLSPLLERWGIAWDSERVAMDRLLGLEVQVSQASGPPVTRTYPLWFGAGSDQMSAEDLTTTALERGINFASPGEIVVFPTSELTVTPLITTSAEGGYTDADIAAISSSPDDLRRDYQQAPQPILLAARLSGDLQSAFPDGPPISDILFRPGDHLDASQRDANITFVTDVDWLDDRYYVRQDPVLGQAMLADNLIFAVNVLDLTIGDPALVGLRSRVPSLRPMSRVDDLRREAETRYAQIRAQHEADIERAQTRLQSLQQTGQASALTGESNAQRRDEVSSLLQEIADDRASMREVERSFRNDIETLHTNLQFWTIGVPPALVILIGLAGTLVRRRRRA